VVPVLLFGFDASTIGGNAHPSRSLREGVRILHLRVFAAGMIVELPVQYYRHWQPRQLAYCTGRFFTRATHAMLKRGLCCRKMAGWMKWCPSHARIVTKRLNIYLDISGSPIVPVFFWPSTAAKFQGEPRQRVHIIHGGGKIFNDGNKLSGRPTQYTLQVDLWPFDLESGVQVTCDVVYFCVNFSLPRPLCSRLRPDVYDRQTSDAYHRLMPPPYGAGHNNRDRCEWTWLKYAHKQFCHHDAQLNGASFSHFHGNALVLRPCVVFIWGFFDRGRGLSYFPFVLASALITLCAS